MCRNRPRRQDRRWATAWSPEQISRRLPIEFPDDETMRISHEGIYQALYIEGSGALKRELVACLRTGRALRVPRARAQQRARGHVTDEVTISERPPSEVRILPGAPSRIDGHMRVGVSWQLGAPAGRDGFTGKKARR